MSAKWFNSSPAIDSSGKIYTCGDSHLYCFNADGSLSWNYGTGSWIWSSPIIGSDGKIYFGSEDNYFYCINPNGTLNWKVATGNSIRSTPAIDNHGKIYIGSEDGYLYCLSISPGTPQWISATPVATNQINLLWHYLSSATSYTLFRNTVNNTNTAIKLQDSC